MKRKNIFPLFLFILILLITVIFVVNYKPTRKNVLRNQTSEFIPNKMFAAKEGYVKEEILNDSSSKKCPQTFLYLLPSEDREVNILMIYTISNIVKNFNKKLSAIPHGNITNLNINGNNYGIFPKKLFANENVDLMSLIKQVGLKVRERKDIIVCKVIDQGQEKIALPMLEKLDTAKLNGAPCTVRAVNCYAGEDSAYQYTIRGTLGYLTPSEKLFLDQTGLTSTGQKYIPIVGEELYYIRIPNFMKDKILGTGGGSVVVTVDGKDYFFGINTRRLYMAIENSAGEVIWGTFIGVQPLVKSDFE